MGRANEYWNDQYQDKGLLENSPSDFLIEMAPRLSNGKCLEIGIGGGSNTRELARLGFDVVGIDISETALDFAKAQAEKENLKIDLRKTDLDLFIFGLMEYDSLVAIDFRPPLTRYYSEFVRSLKQGGTLLIDSLLIDEMPEAIPDEDAFRNYYYRHNELLKHLSGMRILYYHEGVIDGKNRVRLLAQKFMDKDAAKYDLFNIQSKKSEDPARNKQRELAEQLFKKK